MVETKGCTLEEIAKVFEGDDAHVPRVDKLHRETMLIVDEEGDVKERELEEGK